MNEDHERIEELLAGYALLGLSGEDAVEADRLLSDHVPSCPRCRDAVAGFQGVAGELALAAAPAAAPELLLPRIRRDVARIPLSRRRRAPVAAVAGVVAVVSLAGLSASLGNRVSRAEAQRGQLLEVMQVLGQSGADPVGLQSQGEPADGLVQISRPGLERMYVFGRSVPAPAPGRAYQLWLGRDGTFVRVEGGMFVPDDGWVLLEVTIDPTRFDEIMITEEAVGSAPSSPSSQGHVWHAFLAEAAA